MTRRAERIIAQLQEEQDISPLVLAYMNRLSDLLFVLARHANNQGKDDVLWVPGK